MRRWSGENRGPGAAGRGSRAEGAFKEQRARKNTVTVAGRVCRQARTVQSVRQCRREEGVGVCATTGRVSLELVGGRAESSEERKKGTNQSSLAGRRLVRACLSTWEL
jgi:hypothetical protein